MRKSDIISFQVSLDFSHVRVPSNSCLISLKLSNLVSSNNDAFYILIMQQLSINVVLLSKFSRFGLDDEFLELPSSYVIDRHQLVNFCGYLSNTTRVISGVPQGSITGPLLLSIFIKDLPAIFVVSIHWRFADDLKLLFRSLNFENDIATLTLFKLSNGINVNVETTKCLLLSGDVTIRLCDEIFVNVTLQKGLGLMVTSNLKWTNHINYKIN